MERKGTEGLYVYTRPKTAFFACLLVIIKQGKRTLFLLPLTLPSYPIILKMSGSYIAIRDAIPYHIYF
jgi:hypothetical protein